MLLTELYPIKQEGVEERRAKYFAILESRHPDQINFLERVGGMIEVPGFIKKQIKKNYFQTFPHFFERLDFKIALITLCTLTASLIVGKEEMTRFLFFTVFINVSASV